MTRRFTNGEAPGAITYWVEFDAAFDNKPHVTYKLTTSFRFGYLVAQSSYNTIRHNSNRLEKQLLTNNPSDECQVNLITDDASSDGNPNMILSEEVISLVRDRGVSPSDIRVLARTYAQLNSFSSVLLCRKIPFKVLGRPSFLEAGECQTLLDYIRVAAVLNDVPSKATGRRLLNIANKPRRYLLRRGVVEMIGEGRRRQLGLAKLLHGTNQDPGRFFSSRQQDQLESLAEVLDNIYRMICESAEKPLAAPLLRRIDKLVGLQEHYQNYYGGGEVSLTRINNLRSLIGYACSVDMGWQGFIEHVENIDTTLGLPEDQWIKMSTIHAAKGLEFDYVIIPDCKEGYMPIIGSNDDPTYDNANPQGRVQVAEWIENERRLFYVGVTRSKKGLFIGAPGLKVGNSDSSTRAMGVEHQYPFEGHEASKSSRFLEEMELVPTQEVAKELVRAAQGDADSQLAEVCQRLSMFHNIVGTVKAYAAKLPRLIRSKLVQVELSPAERPFAYKQEYANPLDRTAWENGADSDGDPENGPIWGHIDITDLSTGPAGPRRG